MKLFLSLVVIGSFALSAAFSQTSQKEQITGKVVAVTADTITVQKANEPKWVWEIKIGSGTDTTITGKAEVGSQVTVSCIQLNAQKKEAPQ